MWDLRGAHSFGRLSVRNILMFVAAMLATVFIYSFFAAPTAYAADATWKDSTITYKGNQYTPVADAKANDSRGLEKGTKIYAYAEPTASGKKAHLIYFAPGADPPKEKKATYITYDFTPPDTHENPSGKTSISLDPSTASNKGTTSCDATFTHGIGWIVCPITNALAGAMDWLFEVLTGFLAVRPVQTSQDTALFRAWAYMRNFANVAFVIGFLVIIYSQLTSIGITNYAVKKMLPRLVIAAVLVNVSYWICAVAIDISNILGYSIQDIFIAIRNSLVGGEGNNWDVVSWESITGFILSGGTAAAALGVGGYLMVAGAGGAIYLLLPILLGVLMAVLVALLVMAARQAIITILVIISPLAFVAYLLPNTEKYFEKWHKLGLTMLLMFPIFSVVFGGSQLAGQAIIQNADSINLLILGMAVQVAPLAITPLLMRVSGSLLSKIGGVVNNPSKGLIDRSRKWAQERADQHKDRQLAYGTSRLAGTARRIDNSKRKREGWQKANQSMTEANWNKKKTASNIQQRSMTAALSKEGSDAAIQKQFETSKYTNPAMQDLDLQTRGAKQEADVAKAKGDATWEELKAGNANNVVSPTGLSVAGLQRYRDQHAAHAQNAAFDAAIEARRNQSAQNIQQSELAKAFQADITLQQQAGGIDPNGAQRALAEALGKQHSIRGEAVKNANAIIEHSNLTPAKVTDLALGTVGSVKDGITITDDVKEAAIVRIASGKNVVALQNMLDAIDITPLSNENHRIALSEALLANSYKPKFISSTAASDFAQGLSNGLGQGGVDSLIHKAVTAGKYSASVLVAQEDMSLRRVKEAIERNPSQYDPATLAKLGKEIREAYKNPQLSPMIGERDTVLKEILNLI